MRRLLICASVAGLALATAVHAASTAGQLGPWSVSQSQLPAPRAQHGSAVIGGYVYVTGGRAGQGLDRDTVYYAKLNADGTVGPFATNPNPLPVAVSAHSTVASKSYIYVLGGRHVSDTNNLDSVYYAKRRADGSTGPWKTNPHPLPAPRGYATAVAANGYVYVFGGRSVNNDPESTVYYAKVNADGTTGPWTISAEPLPEERILSRAAYFPGNGHVYVVAGEGGGGANNTVYRAELNADGSIDAWATSTLPVYRHNHAVVVGNGRLYLLGGQDETLSTAHAEVYYAKTKADGSLGPWLVNPDPLPTVLAGHTAVAASRHVHVIGGNAGSGQLTTVYSAPIRR